MKVYRHISDIDKMKGSILSIGSFDGVHLGHQKILETTKSLSLKYKTKAAIISFYPSPFSFLYPEKFNGHIDTDLEKIDKVAQCGIDLFAILRFNDKIRRITAKVFLSDIIVKYFKPKVLIPFASFVYFSNTENCYLNDSVNTPNKVLEYFSDSKDVGIKVMKPFEVLNEFVLKEHDNNEALEFWSHSFAISNDTQKNNFETKGLDDLNNSFEVYKERIFQNNSKFFIRLLRMISPVPAFRTILIQLHDINQVVKLNFFQDSLITTDLDPDISMSSESLDFIFNNTFGFDTLTVNGCFEELKKGGFSKMTRTLAIENLNNIGIAVNFSIFLRIDLIVLFLSRLFAVSKKIKN